MELQQAIRCRFKALYRPHSYQRRLVSFLRYVNLHVMELEAWNLNAIYFLVNLCYLVLSYLMIIYLNINCTIGNLVLLFCTSRLTVVSWEAKTEAASACRRHSTHYTWVFTRTSIKKLKKAITRKLGKLALLSYS